MTTPPDFFMTDGAARYRMIRPWHRDTPQARLRNLSQLAVDSRGRVFVLQREAPHVMIFAASGELESTFDDPRLTSGHGIFIDAHDQVYLVSYDAHQVLAFDADLRLRFALGEFNTPHWQAPFNHPTDVAVAPDGELYVTDGYGNACVHRFSAQGEHLQTWGTVGDGPGEFATPHGAWVLPDNRVAVCDRENDRVQIFDREGGYLTQWRHFVRPMDIWCDGTHVFVADQAPRITRLNLEGQIVGRMRTFGVYPHGLWGDAQGSLYVAEQGPTMCVTKYAFVAP